MDAASFENDAVTVPNLTCYVARHMSCAQSVWVRMGQDAPCESSNTELRVGSVGMALSWERYVMPVCVCNRACAVIAPFSGG